MKHKFQKYSPYLPSTLPKLVAHPTNVVSPPELEDGCGLALLRTGCEVTSPKPLLAGTAGKQQQSAKSKSSKHRSRSKSPTTATSKGSAPSSPTHPEVQSPTSTPLTPTNVQPEPRPQDVEGSLPTQPVSTITEGVQPGTPGPADTSKTKQPSAKKVSKSLDDASISLLSSLGVEYAKFSLPAHKTVLDVTTPLQHAQKRSASHPGPFLDPLPQQTTSQPGRTVNGKSPLLVKKDRQPALLLQLLNYIDGELAKLKGNADDLPVGPQRIQIFREAMNVFISQSTVYAPVLDLVMCEYEKYIVHLCKTNDDSIRERRIASEHYERHYKQQLALMTEAAGSHVQQVQAQLQASVASNASLQEQIKAHEVKIASLTADLKETTERTMLMAGSIIEYRVSQQQYEVRLAEAARTAQERDDFKLRLENIMYTLDDMRNRAAGEAAMRDMAEGQRDKAKADMIAAMDELGTARAQMAGMKRQIQKQQDDISVLQSTIQRLNREIAMLTAEGEQRKLLTPRPQWPELSTLFLEGHVRRQKRKRKEIEAELELEGKATSALARRKTIAPDAAAGAGGAAARRRSVVTTPEEGRPPSSGGGSDENAAAAAGGGRRKSVAPPAGRDRRKSIDILDISSKAQKVMEKRQMLLSEDDPQGYLDGLLQKNSSDKIAELIQIIRDSWSENDELLQKVEKLNRIQSFLEDQTQNVEDEMRDTPVSTQNFVGLGTAEHIPKYLRHHGKISNKGTTKREVELFIKEFWKTKVAADEKNGFRASIEDFMYRFCRDKYGSHQAVILMAYNILNACKRFSYDGDCNMFLCILNGDLPEEVYHNQMKMLEDLKREFEKAEAKIVEGGKKKLKGTVPKKVANKVVEAFFSNKTKEDLLKLKFAMHTDQPGKSVNYIELFSEDENFSQGAFVELARSQHVEDVLEYIADLQEALFAHSDDQVTIKMGQIAGVLSEQDPLKTEEEIEEMVKAGVGQASEEEDFGEASLIDVRDFCENLNQHFVTRKTAKDQVQAMLKQKKKDELKRQQAGMPGAPVALKPPTSNLLQLPGAPPRPGDKPMLSTRSSTATDNTNSARQRIKKTGFTVSFSGPQAMEEDGDENDDEDENGDEGEEGEQGEFIC